MTLYQCQVSGAIYDPAEGDPPRNIAPGTPFKRLPDNWVCPECGAHKSDFTPLPEDAAAPDGARRVDNMVESDKGRLTVSSSVSNDELLEEAASASDDAPLDE